MSRGRRTRQYQKQTTASKQQRADDVNLSYRNHYGGDETYGVGFSEYNSNYDCQSIWIEPFVLQFLVKQLVFSRLFLLTFQFFINKMMRDYPTDAFKGIEQVKELSIKDRVVQYLFDGLSCWDARHYLHIAEFGFLWESNLAFFPLFPAVLRLVGSSIKILVGSISLYSAMLLGGVLLNNLIFVVNGILLFRLVFFLTGSLKESIISVYIFCWSPASIFFSTVYTESIYTMFTLSALLFLYSSPTGWTRQFVASFIFSFAFLTRANGLTNIGFIGFQLLLETVLRKSEDESIGKLEFEKFSLDLAKKAMVRIPILIICFAVMALPIRIFGFSMEEKFCSTEALYKDTRVLNYLQNITAQVLPGDFGNLTWCREEGLFPPVLLPRYYPHVQQNYWGVRLFGYWEAKKLPFFLMAAPTLGFVFYGVFDTLLTIASDERPAAEIVSDRRTLLPFALQSLLIAFSGIFLYNIEVSTRLIFSCSPFIYIVIARIISDQTPCVAVPDDLMEPFVLPFLSIYARVRPLHFLMLSYLLGFYFFGTTLHVNWLPFL